MTIESDSFTFIIIIVIIIIIIIIIMESVLREVCSKRLIHRVLWSSNRCLLLLPCPPIPTLFPYVSLSITCSEGGSYARCNNLSYHSFDFIVLYCSFPH